MEKRIKIMVGDDHQLLEDSTNEFLRLMPGKLHEVKFHFIPDGIYDEEYPVPKNIYGVCLTYTPEEQ